MSANSIKFNVALCACAVLFTLGRANAAGEKQLLDRIWKCWQEREARFVTVEISWKQKTIEIDAGAGKTTDRNFKLANGGLARYERIGPTWESGEFRQGRLVDRTFISVFNRRVSADYYGLPKDPASDDFPIGILHKAQSMWADSIRDYFPVRDHFRPTEAILFRDLKLNSSSVKVNGNNCVALSYGKTMLYLDPTRDYVCVRHVSYSNDGGVLTDIHINYDTADERYLPKSWFTEGYVSANQVLSEKSQSIVTAISVNRPFADDVFEPSFPDGTLVTDHTGEEGVVVYLMRPNGMKRIVTRAERRNGLHYQKYLESESGEAVIEAATIRRFRLDR